MNAARNDSSCRFGFADGGVYHPPGGPPCALVDFTSDPAAVVSLLAGRRLFFAGDSMLRDQLRQIQSLALGRDAVMSRQEVKDFCAATLRDQECTFALGDNTAATFSWFQWFGRRSRVHDLILLPEHASAQEHWRTQSLDICEAFESAAVCLDRKLFTGSSPRDVLIVRAGLNYLLFRKYIEGGFEAALAEDLGTFITLARARFKGAVVFLLLAPVLALGQSEKCSGSPILELATVSPFAAHANAILRAQLLAAGIPFVDPWAVTRWTAMESMYRDCVHPDETLQSTTGNAILNIIAASAVR